jgi:hypothetical protein
MAYVLPQPFIHVILLTNGIRVRCVVPRCKHIKQHEMRHYCYVIIRIMM